MFKQVKLRGVQCSECGTVFSTRRSDTHTCSNKCRQARYRRLKEKRDEARKMQLGLALEWPQDAR